MDFGMVLLTMSSIMHQGTKNLTHLMQPQHAGSPICELEQHDQEKERGINWIISKAPA